MMRKSVNNGLVSAIKHLVPRAQLDPKVSSDVESIETKNILDSLNKIHGHIEKALQEGEKLGLNCLFSMSINSKTKHTVWTSGFEEINILASSCKDSTNKGLDYAFEGVRPTSCAYE